MEVTLQSNLPKNVLGQLSFLKLKYGLVPLNADSLEIEKKQFFVCDTESTPISYIKELIRSALFAKNEKQMKADLVVLIHDKAAEESLLQGTKKQAGIIYIVSPKPYERATLFSQALAYVSLMYEIKSEPLYLELMKLGVPLILPKVDAHQSAVGHTAYFLERVHEEDVSGALLKVENSETLRASIQKAASERIAELESGR